LIKSQKGQATVELAISLTLLVFLLFAIIDFGRIFHTYLSLEHAGREAARIASIGGTDAEVTQRARDSAPALHPDSISISISPTKESRKRGTYTTIDLSYPLQISVPLLQNVLPNPLAIKVKTVMRVE
jgi:Flp pilus assembly protein TadG